MLLLLLLLLGRRLLRLLRALLQLRYRITLIGAENFDLHAAVLGTGGAGVTVVNRLLLAESNLVDPIDGDIVFGHQIFRHGIGAFAAERFIVLLRAGAVGEALDSDEIALILRGVGYHAVQVFAVFGSEGVFVECEGYGEIRDLLIVVQVSDDLA